MPYFKKKPLIVEAHELTEDSFLWVMEWCGGRRGYEALLIDTSEGTMQANVGDWIIKGIAGEFYPCKPDVFDKTYDTVGA